jgi:hypothetical protein
MLPYFSRHYSCGPTGVHRLAKVGVIGLALLPLLIGCQKPLYRDQDLAKVLDAYRQGETQARERHRQSAEQSIRRLEVRKTSDGHQVSVDLNRALLAQVIRQILDQSQVPYLAQGELNLQGEVTARFENVPLVRAVNFLLRGQGLSAAMEEEILIIREGEEERQPDDKSTSPRSRGGEGSKTDGTEGRTEARTIALKHMESEVGLKFVQ